MNVTLWIDQGLLALAFIAVGAMKGSAHAKYSLRRSTDQSAGGATVISRILEILSCNLQQFGATG
jgi:hypothetical protein